MCVSLSKQKLYLHSCKYQCYIKGTANIVKGIGVDYYAKNITLKKIHLFGIKIVVCVGIHCALC